MSSTRWLKAGVPLAAAAVLVTIGVVLLVALNRRHESPKPSSEAVSESSRIHVAPSEIPWGSPTDPNPNEKPPPPKRYGGEFPRWNLTEVPRGWNPTLAKEIHDFFEAMDFDPMDETKLVELSRIREEFREYLARLGPDAVPTLGAILNAEGDFVDRRFLLKALGNLGPQSEEATFILRDFLMARVADPRNRSESLHVIEAMGSLRNDTSYESLADMIRNPDAKLEEYRPDLIAALGDHPRNVEATELFVDHVSADREESKRMRNKAAQALGKVKNPETLKDLYASIDRETWLPAKQTMLGSIGKIGNPNSIPYLEEKARLDPDSGVRLSATRAITRIATDHAWQVVREIHAAESSEKLRGYYSKWLAEAGQGGVEATTTPSGAESPDEGSENPTEE